MSVWLWAIEIMAKLWKWDPVLVPPDVKVQSTLLMESMWNRHYTSAHHILAYYVTSRRVMLCDVRGVDSSHMTWVRLESQSGDFRLDKNKTRNLTLTLTPVTRDFTWTFSTRNDLISSPSPKTEKSVQQISYSFLQRQAWKQTILQRETQMGLGLDLRLACLDLP